MKHLAAWIGAFGILFGGDAIADKAEKISRSFVAENITRVVLRAGDAERAVRVDRTGTTIAISGTPIGGAKGYHPADPNWKEIPPEKWGLDFVADRFGDTLVISTKSEIMYIHHLYTLHDIVVALPSQIELVREKRELSGDGAPNLTQPKSR